MSKERFKWKKGDIKKVEEKLPIQKEPTKRQIVLNWDLPPYKSKGFNSSFPDLKEFRLLPIYEAAIKGGLIEDDEWVGPPLGYCPIPRSKK
jgi:hypothetical protein